MNYLIIHKASNLITGVITTSFKPKNSTTHKLVAANAKTLDAYYKWLDKNPNSCPDVCDLATKSKHLSDQLNPKGVKVFATAPREHWEPLPPAANAREASIASWIDLHPSANEHDLHDRFNTGLLAALAYLNKYKP